MRGKKEQRCLDRARRQIAFKNSYGLSKKHFEDMGIYLNSAQQNKRTNEFPDFLFPGGFIEHFQITSSPERRKGSEHIKRELEFRRDCDRKLDDIAECSPTAQVRASYQYKGHSHENLIASFKRNWEKHFESLKKAPQYEARTGIFMVEYCDVFGLQMNGQCYAPLGKGFSPVSDCDTPNGYMLSRDKLLLEYIQQFQRLVKYVIFVDISETEIIAVDHIETRLNDLLLWDYITIAGHPAGFYIGSSVSLDLGGEIE